MLYNMSEVCHNQIGTYGFEAKREKGRFTVVCPRCRQNPKIGHFTDPFYVVVLTSTEEKCTKMRAARAARSVFSLLTNNIAAFWRCRFLNSLFSYA